MPSPSHGFLDSTRTDRLPAWEFPLRFPEDFVCGLDRKAVTQVATLWRRHLCSLLIPRPPGNTPSPAKKGPIHPTPPPSRFPTSRCHKPPLSCSQLLGLNRPARSEQRFLQQPAPGDVRLCLLIRRLSEARFAPGAGTRHKSAAVCMRFHKLQGEPSPAPSGPLCSPPLMEKPRWTALSKCSPLFPFAGNEFLLALCPYHPRPHLWFKSGSHRWFSCYRKMYIVWRWKAGAMSRALKRPWGLIRVKRERIYDG